MIAVMVLADMHIKITNLKMHIVRKEINNMKKNHVEFLVLKSTTSEIKKSLESINIRVDMRKEKSSEPEDKAVIANATSCLEVSTFLYPYTAYTDSYIHTAFENAAATLSGVEAAYNAMKRRGKIEDNFKFIAFFLKVDL